MPSRHARTRERGATMLQDLRHDAVGTQILPPSSSPPRIQGAELLGLGGAPGSAVASRASPAFHHDRAGVAARSSSSVASSSSTFTGLVR